LKKKNTKTYQELSKALGGVLASAYKLHPFAVIIIAFIFLTIIIVSLAFSKIMMGIIVFLVFIVSLVIYSKKQDFGQSALALVAGLLAAFTVEWTKSRFIVFTGVWISFALLTFLFSSIKIASQVESIFRKAAMAIDVEKYQTIEKELHKISKQSRVGYLGPIERAESILILAYRKIPIELYFTILTFIEYLYMISKEDYKTIALFMADLYKSFELKDYTKEGISIDQVIDLIKNAPTSTSEVFQSFKNTRHLFLSDRISLQNYLVYLEKGLSEGVSPNEMTKYIKEQV